MADGAPAERLGEIIRRQRELSELSMRQFATLAGISNPYLSQIERGLREPSERVLDAIAAALQVSAETLYEQAGVTVGEEPVTSAVEEAVREDPRLTGRQRQALLEVYRAFVARARPATRPRHRESGAQLGRRDGSRPRGARARAPARTGAVRARSRMLEHRRHHDRPMVAQRLAAHEEPEVAARRRAPRDALGGRGHGVGQGEDLLGRRDVVGGAGQEVHGALDASEVDRARRRCAASRR